MPPVSAPAKALVTGANGYLGAWLVRTLIEHGYYACGAVRSSAKGEVVREGLGDLGDRFEYIVVSDVLEDGAFDDAVNGVELVMHTLSPVFQSYTPEDIIIPAVTGTMNLLHSVHKHQGTVRRIVITGSVCAILSWPSVDPTVYDEAFMNETSIQVIEKGFIDPIAIYCAAKTQSEKEAWKYIQEHTITAFDVVYLHGSYFYGPPAHPVPSVSALGDSLLCLHSILTQGQLNNDLLRSGIGWIDVRDIALAHVLAGQKDEAGGQRIIISTGDCVVGDLNKVAHGIDSSLPTLTVGVSLEKRYMFDTTKMRMILCLKPRSLEETIRDSLAYFGTIPKSDEM